MDAEVAHVPGHDTLFRQAFSLPLVARQFLTAWLPEEFVASVDWSTLAVHPVSGIDPDLAERRADVVYRVRTRHRPVHLYVLLEHQTRCDRWMARRLHEFHHLIWREHEREADGGVPTAPGMPAAGLPLVIPVVVHPGPGPWSAPRRLFDLLEVPPGLEPWARTFAPDAGYLVVELAGVDLPRLADGHLARAVLGALQAQREAGLGFERVRDLLTELFGEPQQDVALGLARFLWTYLLRHSELQAPEVRRIVTEIAPSVVRESFMSTADMLIQQGLEQGLERGLEQGLELGLERGREEGQVLARQLAVLEVLETRFGTMPPTVRAAVLGVADHERLRRLLRSAIRCPGLEEFARDLPPA